MKKVNENVIYRVAYNGCSNWLVTSEKQVALTEFNRLKSLESCLSVGLYKEVSSTYLLS